VQLGIVWMNLIREFKFIHMTPFLFMTLLRDGPVRVNPHRSSEGGSHAERSRDWGQIPNPCAYTGFSSLPTRSTSTQGTTTRRALHFGAQPCRVSGRISERRTPTLRNRTSVEPP